MIPESPNVCRAKVGRSKRDSLAFLAEAFGPMERRGRKQLADSVRSICGHCSDPGVDAASWGSLRKLFGGDRRNGVVDETVLEAASFAPQITPEKEKTAGPYDADRPEGRKHGEK